MDRDLLDGFSDVESGVNDNREIGGYNDVESNDSVEENDSEKTRSAI